MPKEPCPQCGGYGTQSYTRAEHGCDGTDAMCARVCPVPVEDIEPCDTCGGAGEIETPEGSPADA